jgi:nucleotidyltransferase/DNA polymerase involved in DNA repair
LGNENVSEKKKKTEKTLKKSDNTDTKKDLITHPESVIVGFHHRIASEVVLVVRANNVHAFATE